MNELALPVLGVAFVFGVVMPGAALVSRAAFALLRRHGASRLHGHGGLRYALLVGPTALPLGWFVSACLHQAESGTHPDVCAVPDAPGVLCPEVACFAAALVVLVALAALPRLIREQRVLRGSNSARALCARMRVLALAERDEELARLLRERLLFSERAPEPIATLGVFAHRIVVNSTFALQLDDRALLGALRHEAEHVRNHDPLRYFVAWWALAANPIGRVLLGSELQRWIVAREIHCDREAVLSGASAPALAQALISAARFATPRPTCSALATGDADVLRLRVGLLMAYSDRLPHSCCQAHTLRAAVLALLVAIAMPHHFGTSALDALHTGTESALLYFWR